MKLVKARGRLYQSPFNVTAIVSIQFVKARGRLLYDSPLLALRVH